MKIYSDKKYLPNGFTHCPLLYPFWGIPPTLAGQEFWARRFDRYVESGRRIFELIGIEEAQAAVLPFDWRCVEEDDYLTRVPHPAPEGVSLARQLADDLAAEAAAEKKALCAFFVHDDAARRVPLDNCLVFRPSLLRSTRLPNEFALPAWIIDDLDIAFGGEVPLRAKTATPTVGFCGYTPHPVNTAPRGAKELLRSAVRMLRPRPAAGAAPEGFEARTAALNSLSRSKRLRCEFVIRTLWWNGAVTREGINDALARESRELFLANMLGSDYMLCARGVGNYSYRFYETLCCGRIPVFIDTDCVLPFEEWIDWKRYCVWVEEKDLPHIEDLVLDFHSRLTPRRFQELQRECRQLWVEWLSPQGFFTNFQRYFA